MLLIGRDWLNRSLQTVEKSKDGFVIDFEEDSKQLLRHDFIAKRQSEFFKSKKENLEQGEMLVLCDFSENYSFVVQEESQSFHWSKQQCTIHPFMLYWKEGDSQQKQSIVVIAECTDHNVTAVHLFQNKLINYVKEKHNFTKKLKFFSDGAAPQYKNRKNFYNISQFKTEHGLEAEWHFFATSHGKSPCDGIGGTFKRNARRASIQGKTILTAKQLFDWAIEKESTMVHMYCTLAEYDEALSREIIRYNNIQTIKGTQSYHFFKPATNGHFEVKKYSRCITSHFPKLI